MTRTKIACSGDKVGDILLMGMFGGAICSHWRIEEIRGIDCVLREVKAVSVNNGDGTYSTKYEVVE